MNRKNEFIKNNAILFIGKIATQFITFFLLPLYTNKLATKDYGTIDLIQTYISLLVPVLTLRLDSVVFRFLIDKRDNKDEIQEVVSNTSFLLILGISIAIIISITATIFLDIVYYPYIVTN